MVPTSFIILLGLLAPLLGQAFIMPQLNVLSSPLLAATTGPTVKSAGDSALSSVQWLGSLVSRSAGQRFEDTAAELEKDKSKVDGTGGSVYSRLASTIDAPEEQKERQVWAALANLEKDSTYISRVEVLLRYESYSAHPFDVISAISGSGGWSEAAVVGIGGITVKYGRDFGSIGAFIVRW